MSYDREAAREKAKLQRTANGLMSRVFQALTPAPAKVQATAHEPETTRSSPARLAARRHAANKRAKVARRRNRR